MTTSIAPLFSNTPPATCARCRYWQHKHGTEQDPAGVHIGDCRRHAPRAATHKWQLTYGTDWCGEFSAIPLPIDPSRPAPIVPAPPPCY